MNKHFQRLVLVGLFTLSVAAAGAAFTEVALAGPLNPSCYSLTCDANNGCIPGGNTCTCEFEGGQQFKCIPNQP
jgi:hypothetical protein